jgi:photosystem II stability/assembly factor-like uncharacterized protein
VFIGGLQPFRSRDGGQTWDPVADFHADYHAFAFSAKGDKIYLGNDGGIFSNGTPSAADLSNVNPNWANLNSGLQTALVYPGMSVDDSDGNLTFAGTQDNGILTYKGTSGWSSGVCGDGAFTAIGTPGIAYFTCTPLGTSRSEIYKSNGSFFTTADNGIPSSNEGSLWIAPFVADPSNRNRLYYGASHLYQTSDAAQNWVAISPQFPQQISAIAIAPSDPNYVYAGLWIGKVETTATATAGTDATWTQNNTLLPQRYLTAIAVDSKNPQIAFATFSGFSGFSGDAPGHVFESTDAGASWKDISANLPNVPVSDIALDPDQPGTMFIATDIGIFTTSDSGNTWSPLVDGLPRAVFTNVKLIRGSRILRAASYGRGVWDLSLPGSQGTPTPDFALTGSAQSLSLTRGNSGAIAVSFQALNGFNRDVTLTCSVPPGSINVTCSASPSVINGNQSAKVTIVASTQTATSVARHSDSSPLLALVPLGWLLLWGSQGKRHRKWLSPSSFALVLAVVVALAIAGCGSGGHTPATVPGGGGTNPTSPSSPSNPSSPVSGTVVIQGTSGSEVHSLSVLVTVS